MSTLKSSAEDLTLNADGSGNDIIFQSNAVEKASISDAGLLTTAAINVTGTGDNTVSGTLVVKGGLNANQTSALTLFQQNSTHSTIKAFGADGSTTGILNTYVCASDGSPDTLVTSVTADGLTFNGDTAAANALDDYEEGTWTPTIRDLSGNLATLSTANGSYTKIGRWVQINFQITLSSKGSMTGNYVLMGGIPFNHPTQAYNGTGVIDTWTNFATSFSGLWFDTSSTGSVMWLNAVAAAGGTNSVMPNVAAINDNSHMKGSCMYQISV